MMQIRIEKMDVRYIDAVVQIEKCAFPSPWTKTMFFSEIGQDDTDCYVLLVGNGERFRVAAYVTAWTVLGDCTINKIACHKEFRRLGFGEKILRHLVTRVFAKGAKCIFIEVRESNDTALSFYLKQGFKKTGLRRGYYSDTREDAVLMSLDIEPYINRVFQ